jgi:hypothetical protein
MSMSEASELNTNAEIKTYERAEVPSLRDSKPAPECVRADSIAFLNKTCLHQGAVDNRSAQGANVGNVPNVTEVNSY